MTGLRRPARIVPGVTLIEVMVVSSVMALLMSILVPSLSKARESARRTVCLANLKHIGAGLFSYASQSRDDGPPVMTPMGATAPRQLLSRPGERVNLGLLTPDNIADPQQFHCPSQRKFNFSADLDLLTKKVVAGSYAYAVHLPAEVSPKFSNVRHLALATDDFAAGPGDDGVGRYAHRRGYNVLYTDGSATWYPDTNESIWKRGLDWDDETDYINYASFLKYYASKAQPSGSKWDIFRVWWSFCYFQPDPF